MILFLLENKSILIMENLTKKARSEEIVKVTFKPQSTDRHCYFIVRISLGFVNVYVSFFYECIYF